ncbi:1-aminocyclopropane-1-carboxylate deaminase/D-cysteine desulfhydrase [Cellulophaga sp. HaHaR_3_176]|uniref:1-aminocyclopropane-1-carboxylate deaminase/D-cysteine desulfhydrase n=1 Tax=Cellulophaga sp. HaHaR_3_176 TaxID=1942464 RepID=UPI001C1F4D2A|nr:pyridoxal-phosphate dependent enzyme [Cellulophaga sp. HaHaR_3_176]QWX83089.1 1-aminocyclopropane-1-carboxylate deaminase/D-cysteine desulfhydrase [Cellulophaga sp. HaHaR_3_176]
MNSINQQVKLPLLDQKQISLFVKREDLIHPFISGNKYRKLKYNLIEANIKDYKTILTFGGAYSNHIAATAYAGKENGLRTIGVIRGEELANKWHDNPTLVFAKKNGMQFKFVTREWFRNKNSEEAHQELENEFEKFYIIPEGGSNTLAVKGCEEILNEDDADFDVITSCVGTGSTIAGIINSAKEHQKVIGFPALKGDFLIKDICKFAPEFGWQLQTDYHFGGYAKVSKELIDFINDFKYKTTIALEPVYTGKMMFGLLDLIAKDYFKPGTKILAIHTGGLQGVNGMNIVLKKKSLPLLKV